MSHVNKVLTAAQQKCAESGVRLTTKRQNILQVMVTAGQPLSPYEVVDRYSDMFQEKMPANSAYRILDFLVSENLAHKLASAQKYVVCSHISCDHVHETPQFLICSNCQSVKEIGVQTSLIKKLKSDVEATGYKMTSQQLEIECLCPKCQSKD